MRLRRLILFPAIFVVALCAIVVLAALKFTGHLRGSDFSQASPLSTPAPDIKTVAVYRVTRRDLTRTITLGAELRPYNTAKLYAKVSGYLKKLTVDYGSIVTAGEVIAQLEVPEQQAELERTQTAYNLAKLSYDRIQSVVHETPGLLAQQDVDQARASYEMAAQERNRAQALLDYNTIVAPFDGIVTQRNVDPGALIQEAATSASALPIVEIAEEDKLRLIVEAPESIVPVLQVGTPVSVHVRGTDQNFSDHVARLSYEIHEDTRTMHTEIDIPNNDFRLKPGMYADVTISLAHQNDAVAIPTQALLNDGSSGIIVVDRDNRLRRRIIGIGLQTPDWIAVTSGLQSGEQVFLGDPTSITLGELVRPKIITTMMGAR